MATKLRGWGRRLTTNRSSSTLNQTKQHLPVYQIIPTDQLLTLSPARWGRSSSEYGRYTRVPRDLASPTTPRKGTSHTAPIRLRPVGFQPQVQRFTVRSSMLNGSEGETTLKHVKCKTEVFSIVIQDTASLDQNLSSMLKSGYLCFSVIFSSVERSF